MQEKHGAGQRVEEALGMVETFGSVGTQFFDITHTNINEEKRGFRPKQTLDQVRASMPFLVPSSGRRQNNVIIRPHHPIAPPVLLIQLDDLETEKLERVRSSAFMIVATSPGNFQAWVAVEAGGIADRKDFARRVRKAAGADPSASGATRVAGTANFKPKYAPDFPIVRIEAAQAGHIITADALEALGLLSAPEPARLAPATFKSRNTKGRAGRWPSYQKCVDGAPMVHNGDRPDISRADFTWCMTAIDWGFTPEDTAARLMEESAKAKENGPAYAQETARNAAVAVQRRHRRNTLAL